MVCDESSASSFLDYGSNFQASRVTTQPAPLDTPTMVAVIPAAAEMRRGGLAGAAYL